jgi:hypothetical protein
MIPFLQFMRAFPHSKVGFGATPQLTCLTLSGPSIRRKRHESVMSSVMNNSPSSRPHRIIDIIAKRATRARARQKLFEHLVKKAEKMLRVSLVDLHFS